MIISHLLKAILRGAAVKNSNYIYIYIFLPGEEAAEDYGNQKDILLIKK